MKQIIIYSLFEPFNNSIAVVCFTRFLFPLGTGHVHYAKCSRIYLQMMVNLEHTYLWLYQRFAVEGLFVVRRSERFWAGLWPDLSIEKITMRASKSRGGLTCGSGFTKVYSYYGSTKMCRHYGS